MKTRIVLSLVATIFAIGASLATTVTKNSIAVVNVTADRSTCPADGTCDQGSGACKANANIELYVISGTTCAVAATGTYSL